MNTRFISGSFDTIKTNVRSVRVYKAQFNPALITPDLFSAYDVALPPAVQNSVAKRQAEFLAGRICAKQALLASGIARWTVAVGPHREPIWPNNMVGSISHSDHHVVAAVAPLRDVEGLGIDIETVMTSETCASIMPIVISRTECAYLDSILSSFDKEVLLTLVFSAKESFFKAAFRQVRDFFDFDSLELCTLDLQRQCLLMHTTRSLSSTIPAGMPVLVHFEMFDGAAVMTSVVLTSGQSEGCALKKY